MGNGGVAAVSPARPPRRRGARRLTRDSLAAYTLVAPALALLALYIVVPLFYTVAISFQDVHLGIVPYSGTTGAGGGAAAHRASVVATFFGLHNWVHLFTADPVFVLAVRNTAAMVGGATALGTVTALLAALLVSRRLPFMGLFRAAYFFPAAVSQVVAGLVFAWLFDQNFGLVNHLLGFIGLGPYLWQDNAVALLAVLTLAAAWLTASYNLPIFAAALRNVPRAQQEAAALDGAGVWRTLWHVTLPALRPATWFVGISSLVAVAQMLGLYDALAQDTVESSTLVKYMFARAFYYNDVDYAGAIAVVMIVSLTTLALLGLWLGDRGRDRAGQGS